MKNTEGDSKGKDSAHQKKQACAKRDRGGRCESQKGSMELLYRSAKYTTSTYVRRMAKKGAAVVLSYVQRCSLKSGAKNG